MLSFLPDAESPLLVALTALLMAAVAAGLALLVWGVPTGIPLHFALVSSRGSITVVLGVTLLVALAFAQGGAALSFPERIMALVLLLAIVAVCSVVPVASAAHRARRVMGVIAGARSTVSLDARGDVVVSSRTGEMAPVLGRMLPRAPMSQRVAVLSYEDAVLLTGMLVASDAPNVRRLALAN